MFISKQEYYALLDDRADIAHLYNLAKQEIADKEHDEEVAFENRIELFEEVMPYLIPEFNEVCHLIENRESSKIKIGYIYDKSKKSGYIREMFSEYSDEDNRLLKSYESTIRECNNRLNEIKESKENKK